MSRPVSNGFLNDLKNGILAPIASRVRVDDTLMLAFRGNSINVYYRGGSILRLTQQAEAGRYKPEFDPNYEKNGVKASSDLPVVIGTVADCEAWIGAFPVLKQIMDFYFAKHRKLEREFQQLVAWENNRSGIANSTEYFITDIEYADVLHGARLDMLGLKWPSTDRQDGSRCTPVLIEMKYGIGSYEGDAGIVKHVADLRGMLSRETTMDRLNQDIAGQFAQLDELKLVNFNKAKSFKNVEVVGKPEVILLLANHNPRSRTLLNALEKIEEPSGINLRFFAASFAGYGLHDACMMDLEEFRELVSSHLTKGKRLIGSAHRT
jgi:hypothetical protein